jgi:glycerol-3-phosphate acyltransferase PlsY
MQWVLYAFGAYLLGSIPFGKLIARKVARIDITKKGSGNIGATNVAREIGIGWGLLTLLLDMLKGLVPVALFSAYGHPSAPTFQIGLALTGLCALLGHQFSLFESFRGGKGVATALGVYLGISPLTCLVAVPLFVFVVYKWDFVSLGSLVASCAVPILLALFGEAIPLILGSLIAAALICFKHRDNIRRLSQGTENRWRMGKGQVKRSKSLSSSSSE